MEGVQKQEKCILRKRAKLVKTRIETLNVNKVNMQQESERGQIRMYSMKLTLRRTAVTAVSLKISYIISDNIDVSNIPTCIYLSIYLSMHIHIMSYVCMYRYDTLYIPLKTCIPRYT